VSEPLLAVPPPLWTPSNREYHSDSSRWSSTSLKLFRNRPQLAYRTYVKRGARRPGATPEQIIGSAVNTLLLEPETANRAIVTVEVDSRNSATFHKASALYPEALVLTRPEREMAGGIADAILNPQTDYAVMARELLIDRPGYSEYATRWEDETGVPCKSKIDRLTSAPAENEIALVVGELKTANDPEFAAFSRAVDKFDYYCQAAFNCRGIYATTGHWPSFVFIVVRNEEPYEVACYQITEEYMALGYQQVVKDLEKLSDCLQDPTGKLWRAEWENFAIPGLASIPEIDMPHHRKLVF
jgi:hypothetical protein